MNKFNLSSVLDTDTNTYKVVVRLADELDYESDEKSYNITVSAVDSDDTEPRTTNASFYIEVLDTNDNQPLFEDDNLTEIHVLENATVGELLHTINASDADSGVNKEIVFKLLSFDEIFGINTTTGELTLEAAIDRENKAEYILRVQATDGGTPEQSSTVDYVVVVGDVNDEYPVFNVPDYDPRKSEGTDVGSTLAVVKALDADEGDNANVTYAISSGNDDDIFAINTLDGTITLADEFDFEGDAQNYLVTVTATDQGTPSNNKSLQLFFVVVNENEHAPIVTPSDDVVINLAENLNSQIIHTFNVSDDDDGAYGVVTMAIVSGNDGGEFHLDSATGVLVLVKAIDFENQTQYDLVVRGTDGADGANAKTSDDVAVRVNVLDENDNSPVFNVPESEALQLVDSTAVGTPLITCGATDLDAENNSKLVYSLEDHSGMLLVSVGESTGVVTLARRLPAAGTHFSVTVVAHDQGDIPRSTSKNFTVDVVGTVHSTLSVSGGDALVSQEFTAVSPSEFRQAILKVDNNGGTSDSVAVRADYGSDAHDVAELVPEVLKRAFRLVAAPISGASISATDLEVTVGVQALGEDWSTGTESAEVALIVEPPAGHNDSAVKSTCATSVDQSSCLLVAHIPVEWFESVEASGAEVNVSVGFVDGRGDAVASQYTLVAAPGPQLNDTLTLALPDPSVRFGGSTTMALWGQMAKGITSFAARIRINSTDVAFSGVRDANEDFKLSVVYHSNETVIVTGILLANITAASTVPQVLGYVDLAIDNDALDQCASVELFVDHLTNTKRGSAVPHAANITFASEAGGPEKCLTVVGDEDPAVALLPSATPSYLWNTAMLNGVQVSSKVELTGLTRYGKLVELDDCTCSSAADDVVQVHANCSSIFLDGTELKGSSSAKINVECGNLAGEIYMSVLAPHLPIDLETTASKLYTLAGVAASPDSCDLALHRAELKATTNFSDGSTTYENVDVMPWVHNVIESSSTKVAAIDGYGAVQGLKAGRAVIEVIVPGLSDITSPLSIMASATEKNPIINLRVNVVRDFDVSIQHAETPTRFARSLVPEVSFVPNQMLYFLDTNASVVVSAVFEDGSVSTHIPGPSVTLSVSDPNVLKLHSDGRIQAEGYGVSNVVASWNANGGNDCDNGNLTYEHSVEVIVGLPSKVDELIIEGVVPKLAYEGSMADKLGIPVTMSLKVKLTLQDGSVHTITGDETLITIEEVDSSSGSSVLDLTEVDEQSQVLNVSVNSPHASGTTTLRVAVPAFNLTTDIELDLMMLLEFTAKATPYPEYKDSHKHELDALRQLGDTTQLREALVTCYASFSDGSSIDATSLTTAVANITSSDGVDGDHVIIKELGEGGSGAPYVVSLDPDASTGSLSVQVTATNHSDESVTAEFGVDVLPDENEAVATLTDLALEGSTTATLGQTGQLLVGVVFEDGTQIDALFGENGYAVDGLVTFGSTRPSVVNVSAATGVAEPLDNFAKPVLVDAESGPSTSLLLVNSNFAALEGDVDIGQQNGVHLPSVPVEETFKFDVSINAGNHENASVIFVLKYDRKRLTPIDFTAPSNVVFSKTDLTDDGSITLDFDAANLAGDGTVSKVATFEFEAVRVGEAKINGNIKKFESFEGVAISADLPKASVAGDGVVVISKSRRRRRRQQRRVGDDAVHSSGSSRAGQARRDAHGAMKACTDNGESELCSCFGSTVDCSKRRIETVPKGIPAGTTELDLSSNLITELAANAFAGLEAVETLDLSRNMLVALDSTALASLNKTATTLNFSAMHNAIKVVADGLLDEFNFTTLSMEENPSVCQRSDSNGDGEEDNVVCDCAAGYLGSDNNSSCTESCGDNLFAQEDGACDNCTQCATGEYLVTVCKPDQDAVCMPCLDGCAVCDAGEPSNCAECDDGLYLHEDLCHAACPVGMFETSNATCSTCDDSCLTCAEEFGGNTNTSCTACKEEYVLLADGSCAESNVCPNNTFGFGGVCRDCTPSCSVCSNSSLPFECETCSSGYQRNPVDGTCTATCPQGQYNTEAGECGTCDEGCAICQAEDGECMQCNAALSLFNGTCVESCESDFFSRQSLSGGDACVACQEPCNPGTFETRECTAGSDRTCTPCQECSAGSYTIGGCVNSTETECKDWSAACEEGQYETRRPSAMFDRSCGACSTSAPDGHYKVHNCSSSTDTVYNRCSVCKSTEYVAANCTNTSDTQCAACGDGTWDSCIAEELPNCRDGSNPPCKKCPAGNNHPGDVNRDCAFDDADVRYSHLFESNLLSLAYDGSAAAGVPDPEDGLLDVQAKTLDSNVDGENSMQDAYFLSEALQRRLDFVEVPMIYSVGLPRGECQLGFTMSVLSNGSSSYAFADSLQVYIALSTTDNDTSVLEITNITGASMTNNFTDGNASGVLLLLEGNATDDDGNKVFTVAADVASQLTNVGVSVLQTTAGGEYLHVGNGKTTAPELGVVLQLGEGENLNPLTSFDSNTTAYCTNDFEPIFEEEPYAFNVKENTDVGTVVHTFNVTDDDEGENGMLNFEIVDTSPKTSLFKLSADGVLTVAAELDFENDDEVNDYNVTVLVKDRGDAANSLLSRNASTLVQISVTDENDNKPIPGKAFVAQTVVENTVINSVIAFVRFTDLDSGDNSKVTLILSGCDLSKGPIAFDPDSGNFTVAEEIDFEELNVTNYDCIVTATDGGEDSQNATARVVIALEGANDNKPKFDAAAYKGTIAESTAVGTAIITVFASDSDKGAANDSIVLYKLAGDEATSFAIDKNNGSITVVKALDYETTTGYKFEVKAYNPGDEPVTRVVLVDVTDINDNVPVCAVASDFNSSGVYTYPDDPEGLLNIAINLTVAEDVGEGTAVVQLNATDEDSDANSKVKFSVADVQPDSSAGLFTVDEDAGTVTLNGTLDRETLDYYVVTVAAVDGGDPSLQQNVTFVLTVSDVNDVVPNFTSSLYSYSLSEDVSVGTVVGTVKANDADSEAGYNNVVAYSLEGLGNEYFNVSESSGEIVVAQALDRETNASYELTVVGANAAAQEEAGDDVDFDEGKATIQIEITDINDNSPVMNESFAIDVKENVANGTVLLELEVVDPDVEDAANVTFSITSGNEDGCFAVSSANNPEGELVLTCVLDRETNASYSIGILAQDSAACTLEKGDGANSDGSACISETVVEVEIVDLNDNAPTVAIVPEEPVVPENATDGTLVLETQLDDKDQANTNNSKTRLELTGGDGCFEIDDKGALRVNCTLDRETTQSYELEITVFDHGEPELNSSITFVVNISDVQDNVPVIEDDAYECSLNEDAAIGAQCDGANLTIRATDPDKAGPVTLSIVNSSAFEVDGAGKVVVIGGLDRETKASYDLIILATDSGAPPFTSNVSLTITVEDVNDNIPKFNSTVIDVSIDEDAVKDTNVTGLTPYASDADVGDNAVLVYRLASGNATLFAVGNSSGVVSLVGGLDYERSAVHGVFVEVFNPSNPNASSSVLVNISVVDINDNRPIFVEQNYSCNVTEDIGTTTKDPAVVENCTVVVATDKDSGANGLIRYAFANDDDENRFAVDNVTGQVTVLRNNETDIVDREANASITLVVNAFDLGTPESNASIQASVVINIVDANDNPPLFLHPNYTCTLQEGAAVGSACATVEASDADVEGTAFSYVMYSSKNTSSFIAVNASTGDVVTNEELNCTTNASLVGTVTAADNGDTMGVPSLSTDVSVFIHITSASGYVPRLPASSGVCSVLENAPLGVVCPAVKATPACQDSTVVFALNDTHDGRFSIDAESGEVSLLNELDFEAEKEYTLDVFISDKVFTNATELFSLSVVVLDVNDNTPLFDSENYACHVKENLAVGAKCAGLASLATDKDEEGTARSTISYSIVEDGNSSTATPAFEVDSKTGKVTTLATLDFEVESSYSFTITATDNDPAKPLNSTTVLVITVDDENDNDPLFVASTVPAAALVVSENDLSQSLLASFEATDKDSLVNANISFSIAAGDANQSFSVEDGFLTLVSELDFEAAEFYTLTIVVSDQGVPVERHTTVQVSVNVTDVNDCIPTFTETAYDCEVTETLALANATDDDSSSGSANASVICSIPPAKDNDKAGTPNSAISYELDDPSEEFSIDPATGTILSTLQFDRERQAEYYMKVKAVDAGKLPLSSVVTVRVTVLDLNENPAFDEDVYRASVTEGSPTSTFVASVFAVDEDMPGTANASITFVIKEGNDNNLFKINSYSGSIFTDGDIDREEFSNHTLLIEVADGGDPSLSANARLIITVNDVNDCDPVFPPSLGDPATFSVSEHSKVGTSFAVLTASDNDAGANGEVSYALEDETGTFDISATGTLFTTSLLDREKVDTYIVVVTAADGGGAADQNTADLRLIIRVTDTNEHAPLFDPIFLAVSRQGITVPDNMQSGGVITTAIATDNDLGENASVSFRLDPILTTGPFVLGNNSGQLMLDGTFPQNEVTDYAAQVIAEDGGQVNQLQTSLAVRVTVQPFLRANSPTTIVANWLLSYPRQDRFESYTLNMRQPLLCDAVYGRRSDCSTTPRLVYEGTDRSALTTSSLVPSTKYQFRLGQVLTSGNVEYSPWREVVTPVAAPEQVDAVEVTPLSTETVLLSWNMPGLPNGEVFYFIVVEKVTGVAPEGTLRPAGRTLNVTADVLNYTLDRVEWPFNYRYQLQVVGEGGSTLGPTKQYVPVSTTVTTSTATTATSTTTIFFNASLVNARKSASAGIGLTAGLIILAVGLLILVFACVRSREDMKNSNDFIVSDLEAFNAQPSSSEVTGYTNAPDGMEWDGSQWIHASTVSDIAGGGMASFGPNRGGRFASINLGTFGTSRDHEEPAIAETKFIDSRNRLSVSSGLMSSISPHDFAAHYAMLVNQGLFEAEFNAVGGRMSTPGGLAVELATVLDKHLAIARAPEEQRGENAFALWDFIMGNNIQIVGSVGNGTDGQQGSPPWWPDEPNPIIDCPEYQVEQTLKADAGPIARRVLEVTDYGGGTTAIQHLQKHGAGVVDGVLKSEEEFAMFYIMLKELHRQSGSTGPLLLQCSTGQRGSACFCVVDACVRNALEAGTVDVPRVLRMYRDLRPGLLPTLAEYVFCNKVLVRIFSMLPGATPLPNTDPSLSNIVGKWADESGLVGRDEISSLASGSKFYMDVHPGGIANSSNAASPINNNNNSNYSATSPGSNYSNASNYNAASRSVTLDRSGGKRLGVRLGNAAGAGQPIPVLDVHEGSQAQGKINAGDSILAVNGNSVLGMNMNDAATFFGDDPLIVFSIAQTGASNTSNYNAASPNNTSNNSAGSPINRPAGRQQQLVQPPQVGGQAVFPTPVRTDFARKASMKKRTDIETAMATMASQLVKINENVEYARTQQEQRGFSAPIYGNDNGAVQHLTVTLTRPSLDDTFGIALETANGQLSVGRVAKHGPANGLVMPNDVITAVSDENAVSLDGDGVRKVLEYMETQTTVHLGINRLVQSEGVSPQGSAWEAELEAATMQRALVEKALADMATELADLKHAIANPAPAAAPAIATHADLAEATANGHDTYDHLNHGGGGNNNANPNDVVYATSFEDAWGGAMPTLDQAALGLGGPQPDSNNIYDTASPGGVGGAGSPLQTGGYGSGLDLSVYDNAGYNTDGSHAGGAALEHRSSLLPGASRGGNSSDGVDPSMWGLPEDDGDGAGAGEVDMTKERLAKLQGILEKQKLKKSRKSQVDLHNLWDGDDISLPSSDGEAEVRPDPGQERLRRFTALFESGPKEHKPTFRGSVRKLIAGGTNLPTRARSKDSVRKVAGLSSLDDVAVPTGAAAAAADLYGPVIGEDNEEAVNTSTSTSAGAAAPAKADFAYNSSQMNELFSPTAAAAAPSLGLGGARKEEEEDPFDMKF